MNYIELALLLIIVLLIVIIVLLLGTGANRSAAMREAGATLRTMRKSWVNQMVCGVCSGFGKHTPMPTWVWRAIFLALLFFGGVGLGAYFILAICLPQDDERAV